MTYQRTQRDVIYRPTVRYDASYRDYVNDLFHSTTLDRNQLIRAALFIAAHSEDYTRLLKPYMKKDVLFPRPKWSATDHAVWLEQCPVKEEQKGDVVYGGEEEIGGTEPQVEVRRQPTEQRSLRPVHQERSESGGIKLFFS